MIGNVCAFVSIFLIYVYLHIALPRKPMHKSLAYMHTSLHTMILMLYALRFSCYI